MTSPPNFDEMVREFEVLCERYKALFTKLPTELPESAPSLEQLGFTLPQGKRALVGTHLDMLAFHRLVFSASSAVPLMIC